MRGASRASPSQQTMPIAAMYHLSRHAFACKTGRYYVFLDLRRDMYFSIPREDLDGFAPWIQGGPPTPRMELPEVAHLSAAATALATELVDAGVLREGPPEQRLSARVASTPVSDLASTRASLNPAERRCYLFMSIATSLTYARWALRFTPIYSIVSAVDDRKRGQTEIDLGRWERAAQLTAVFLDYRPLFPWDYRCLFDSLALIRFLSRFGLYPDWVFGVQDDPFSAHCWVQAGTQVLNDDLEHVCHYTPIMTI